jgi:hypothetical protein
VFVASGEGFTKPADDALLEVRKDQQQQQQQQQQQNCHVV